VTAATPRGQARRELLLNATAELVAARGFHAVGIADIGAAAGVTGSAIYRHFASKEEILVALFDQVLDELLLGARVARAQPKPFDALVERHVDFALDDRALIKVWSREALNLPDGDRRRLRRKQRAYADLWVDVVVRSRSELSPSAAAAVVHGVFGLLNSVADYDPDIPHAEQRTLLTKSALAVLRSA
jgi:AcrR family transcriptional regulator